MKESNFVPTVEVCVMRSLKLDWWNLRGYSSRDGTGYPWSRAGQLEREGWCGLNISNMSRGEHRLVRQWAADRPETVWLSRKERVDGERWVEHFIGEYEDWCVMIWLSSERLRDEFVTLLKGFPQRTKVILCRDMKPIKTFLSGNYHVLKGSCCSAVGYTDEISPVDEMLMKLAVV